MESLYQVGQATLSLGAAMLAVLNTSLFSMFLSRASRKVCFMIFPGTEIMGLTSWEFPGSFFLPFFKMGTMFPFFLWLHLTATLFKYHEKWLVIKSANSWDSGIHLITFDRLRYVQVLQVVPNLIFPYSRRDFVPPGIVLWTIHLRGVRREVASEDWGKKVVEYLSLLLICCYQFTSLV